MYVREVHVVCMYVPEVHIVCTCVGNMWHVRAYCYCCAVASGSLLQDFVCHDTCVLVAVLLLHACLHLLHACLVPPTCMPCTCMLYVSLSMLFTHTTSMSFSYMHDDDTRAVYCSFLETNFVYLWEGYVLHVYIHVLLRHACLVRWNSHLVHVVAKCMLVRRPPTTVMSFSYMYALYMYSNYRCLLYTQYYVHAPLLMHTCKLMPLNYILFFFSHNTPSSYSRRS